MINLQHSKNAAWLTKPMLSPGRPMLSMFLAEKAPELFLGRLVVEEHVEDLLEPARAPRMPRDVPNNRRGWRRSKKGKRS